MKRRRWDEGESTAAKAVTPVENYESNGSSIKNDSSDAPKFSLGALEKARKALQMQKELNAKLAKLPQLGKLPAAKAPTLQPSPVQQQVPTPVPVASNPQPQGSALIPGLGMASSLGFGVNTSAAMAGSGLDAAAMLRAQQAVAQQLGIHLPLMTAGMMDFMMGAKSSTKAPVLRLDAHGREIDENGNVIGKDSHGPVSTLKVNINKAKKEAFKILRPDLEADPVDSPFFDPRMQQTTKTKLVKPKRAALHFVQEGEMIKRAENIRLRAQFGGNRFAENQARLARARAIQGQDLNPNMIEIGERVVIQDIKKSTEPIPDIEWWDTPLLPQGTYAPEGQPMEMKTSKISMYVEHPVPIEPPAEPPAPPPQPLKLTKKEQKKLRTQRRLAREKERQEMIRQGLLEPPKPKIKMSNLMRVLGAQATNDPTRMEQEVRTAAAQREQAHADRNLARKLTPAEKREKKERKLFEDMKVETLVAVYRVGHLKHPQTRFKVDVNAQENRLSGRCAMTDSMAVVIVEGGGKSLKRFEKLMLRRIDWAAAVAPGSEDMEDEEGEKNYCKLVWQGAVARAMFHDFRLEEFRTDAAARKFLEGKGFAHYWDLAVNFPSD